MTRSPLLGLAAVVLVAAACGGGAGDSPAPGSTGPGETAAPGETGEAPAMTRDPSTGTVQQAAIADLATRLRVEPAEIRVLSSRKRTWPDTSLGCPQPDVSYAQVETLGVQVVLLHGERAFDYRAPAAGTPVLCATGEDDGGQEFVPPPGFDE